MLRMQELLTSDEWIPAPNDPLWKKDRTLPSGNYVINGPEMPRVEFEITDKIKAMADEYLDLYQKHGKIDLEGSTNVLKIYSASSGTKRVIGSTTRPLHISIMITLSFKKRGSSTFLDSFNKNENIIVTLLECVNNPTRQIANQRKKLWENHSVEDILRLSEPGASVSIQNVQPPQIPTDDPFVKQIAHPPPKQSTGKRGRPRKTDPPKPPPDLREYLIKTFAQFEEVFNEAYNEQCASLKPFEGSIWSLKKSITNDEYIFGTKVSIDMPPDIVRSILDLPQHQNMRIKQQYTPQNFKSELKEYCSCDSKIEFLFKMDKWIMTAQSHDVFGGFNEQFNIFPFTGALRWRKEADADSTILQKGFERYFYMRVQMEFLSNRDRRTFDSGNTKDDGTNAKGIIYKIQNKCGYEKGFSYIGYSAEQNWLKNAIVELYKSQLIPTSITKQTKLQIFLGNTPVENMEFSIICKTQNSEPVLKKAIKDADAYNGYNEEPKQPFVPFRGYQRKW